jgi:sugar lactone lactonase YvrE
VDKNNDRVQYFTSSGSFLGKWGKEGSGDGEFDTPNCAAFSPDGRRVYVGDLWNDRVQYFRWTDSRVAPTSLGRVKTLFR